MIIALQYFDMNENILIRFDPVRQTMMMPAAITKIVYVMKAQKIFQGR